MTVRIYFMLARRVPPVTSPVHKMLALKSPAEAVDNASATVRGDALHGEAAGAVGAGEGAGAGTTG